MKPRRCTVLLPLIAAGCAFLPGKPVAADPRVLTQRSPEEMAACIGGAIGVAPVSTDAGLVVETPGQPERFVITRDKEQTVVNVEGGDGSGTAGDAAAIRCGLTGRAS